LECHEVSELPVSNAKKAGNKVLHASPARKALSDLPSRKESVMPTSTPANASPPINIQELAEWRLRSNPYPGLKYIRCEFRDGVLRLRGCLPTYYLKQRAQEAVAHLEGVTCTVNEIQVVTMIRPR
jgi:BON domain-containing protein